MIVVDNITKMIHGERYDPNPKVVVMVEVEMMALVVF